MNDEIPLSLDDDAYKMDIKGYTTMGSLDDYGLIWGLYYHCRNVFMDIYAATVIFIFHLITLETFLVIGISITSTLFYYKLEKTIINEFNFISLR